MRPARKRAGCACATTSRGASGGTGASAWDATAGKRLWQARRDGNWLQAVAISPDGRAIAVAEQSGAVALLDPAGGRELRRLVSNGNAGSVRLAFAPDSRTLAV